MDRKIDGEVGRASSRREGLGGHGGFGGVIFGKDVVDIPQPGACIASGPLHLSLFFISVSDFFSSLSSFLIFSWFQS